jgi:hypothetical protein
MYTMYSLVIYDSEGKEFLAYARRCLRAFAAAAAAIPSRAERLDPRVEHRNAGHFEVTGSVTRCISITL